MKNLLIIETILVFELVFMYMMSMGSIVSRSKVENFIKLYNLTLYTCEIVTIIIIGFSVWNLVKFYILN